MHLLQVFHLYKGQADNETLLLNYGFALPENPYDSWNAERHQ